MGSVVGVVPAAGRSTRIGNPKPLLDADGATFLERTVGALRAGGCDPVLVGVREPRGPIHAMAARAGGTPLVPPDVDDGPIATIRVALAWCREHLGPDAPEALVLLPVDHPLVRGDTVAALIEAFRQGGADRDDADRGDADRGDAGDGAPEHGDAHLVLATHQGETGHPALFAGPLLAELEDPDLDEGARTVVRRHRASAVLVEVDDPGVHVDIDTLAEYRRFFPRAYRKRFQKW